MRNSAPIISTPNPDKENGTSRAAFVCAEPSPDALSALSAAFSGGFVLTRKDREFRHALATAVNETAKQLGRRNATIQLLRDGLYRQCEAYMNGLIDPEDYSWIANKYINAMVVLLAIEQITPEPGVIDSENGEGLGGGVPARAAVNKRVSAEDDGDGEVEPQGSDPTEPSGEAPVPVTPDDDTPDHPDPEDAEPVETAPVQDGNAEVSKAVADAVYEMTQAFLRKDTLDFCLRVLLKPGTDLTFENMCKMIVVTEYYGGRDIAPAILASLLVSLLDLPDLPDREGSDPPEPTSPELTLEERERIINPE